MSSSATNRVSPFPFHPCPFWSLGTLHLILLIFSIALLAMGTRIRNDSASVQTVSGYSRAECTLTAVQVNMCPMNKGYVAVFRRKEDGGTSVVASPFALTATRDEAERHFNDYPLNVTLPCMCNHNYMDPYPALTCAMNDACMMDVKTVEYMQTVSGVYGYSGDTLIAIGSLLLVTAVTGIALLAGLAGWCRCCCVTKNDDYVFANKILSSDV